MKNETALRFRALFAKLPDENKAILVAAVDETIWEHQEDEEWIGVRESWPDEYEWSEAWLVLADADYVRRELFPAETTFFPAIVRADA